MQNFALKRVVGGVSWKWNRANIHSPEIALAVRQDILAAKVDHVAFTGDLVNIAAAAEFQAGANWLHEFGASDWLSFVPGNHDAYVPIEWEAGLGHFAAYMTSDMAIEKAASSKAVAMPFPYVRLRRNVALIGLSTAIAQPLHKAGGALGVVQRTALTNVLKLLRERGFYRAIMLHHPPLPHMATPQKALQDAKLLGEILADAGAELVVHGHNHRPMQQIMKGRTGNTAIVGVSSASSSGKSHHSPAGWNQYEISRQNGQWATRMTTRIWQPELKVMADGPTSAFLS